MSSQQFGFYCPNTKTFYYVPNQEIYEELLKQLRQTSTEKE